MSMTNITIKGKIVTESPHCQIPQGPYRVQGAFDLYYLYVHTFRLWKYAVG